MPFVQNGTVDKEYNQIILGNFQNHDVTRTGLTWPKSQTRLGKNFESISINHKTIPLLYKTIGMKSKQWIFSGSSKNEEHGGRSTAITLLEAYQT